MLAFYQNYGRSTTCGRRGVRPPTGQSPLHRGPRCWCEPGPASSPPKQPHRLRRAAVRPPRALHVAPALCHVLMARRRCGFSADEPAVSCGASRQRAALRFTQCHAHAGTRPGRRVSGVCRCVRMWRGLGCSSGWCRSARLDVPGVCSHTHSLASPRWPLAPTLGCGADDPHGVGLVPLLNRQLSLPSNGTAF